MNFIVSLAHFCEIHGPTSVLCTQAIPPSCASCFPPAATSVTPPSNTPHQSFATSGSQLPSPNNKTGPSHNVSGSHNGGLRPNTSHHGTSANSSSASSSNLSSPMETPPPSPRSPVMTSPPLPAAVAGIGIGPGYLGGPANPGSTTLAASSAMADTCRSCSITLPSRVSEKLPGGSPASSPAIGGRPAAGRGNYTPVLRTKELVVSNAPSVSSEDEDDALEGQLRSYFRRRRRMESVEAERLSGSPTSRSYFNSAPASDDEAATTSGKPSSGRSSSLSSCMHKHHVTYLSTRAPSVPSRYSTLRQSCVRTLSCELIPAQTGPIMFGDPLAGYTIAYVFRLTDPKARGGRRSYALLCICPDQKVVVKSWKYVVAAFESLVNRIKLLAAKKASEDTHVSSPALSNSMSSITSRGPEGFLRARAPGEGGSQKGLAELVGREELFVEVHMCFVKLLGGLVRRYGCWTGGGGEMGLSIGLGSAFATPISGRSRAGSVVSDAGGENRKADTSPPLGEGKGLAFQTPPGISSMAALSISDESRAAAVANREENSHRRYS